LPGCFGYVIDFFDKYPDVDIFYGDYRLIDVDGKVMEIKKELPFDMFALKYHHVLCIPSTTCFFRRRIFDEGSFLDITYHYAMDYEFFLRLALKGYRFVHSPFLVADFRWHAGAKSSRETVLQAQEREQALIKYDDFLRGFPAALRQMVRFIFMVFSRCKRMIQKIFL
jgi:GT2 family glycosyltransferase